MKILLITGTLEPTSGLGRYSLSIADALVTQGCHVRVLTESRGNSMREYEKSELSQKKGVFSFLKNIAMVRREARGFDVVHALDGWPYGVWAMFGVMGTNRKLFINGVGTYSMVPRKSSLKRMLMIAAYRRAEKIFCISDYVRDRLLEQVGRENILTVLLGAPKLPQVTDIECARFDKKYKSLDNRYPVLLTVGEIKDRKGQLETLRAAGMLKGDYPNFLYVIVGSDKDRAYVNSIKEYAAQHNITDNLLIISDARDDKELAFLYQASDIFIMNSNNSGLHFEGFGLVFLEAAQFGKPVIGSRGCGIESAIHDGGNGFLTNQRDSADIYQKILYVLKSESRQLFDKASKDFYKKFSWSNTTSRYAEHYRAAFSTAA